MLPSVDYTEVSARRSIIARGVPNGKPIREKRNLSIKGYQISCQQL